MASGKASEGASRPLLPPAATATGGRREGSPDSLGWLGGCGLWLATVIRHSLWMTVTHIRGRSCTGIGGVKLTIQLYFALINLLTFMFPQP